MIARDFERIAPVSMLPHEEEHVCATIEDWPEDEFAHWVASHRDEVKTLVCGSLSYGELGVCQG